MTRRDTEPGERETPMDAPFGKLGRFQMETRDGRGFADFLNSAGNVIATLSNCGYSDYTAIKKFIEAKAAPRGTCDGCKHRGELEDGASDKVFWCRVLSIHIAESFTVHGQPFGCAAFEKKEKYEG